VRDKPWRNQPPTTVTLAGIPVKRELVEWLAQTTDEPTAGRLERALTLGTRLLALEINEREQILRALDDPPAGLEELRGVLLQEHVGRAREGLWLPISSRAEDAVRLNDRVLYRLALAPTEIFDVVPLGKDFDRNMADRRVGREQMSETRYLEFGRESRVETVRIGVRH